MKQLVKALTAQGGRCVLIGGAVIDSLQNLPIKDWDIEVFGLSMSQIEEVLDGLGLPFSTVGKAFGVIKTRIEDRDIDLSIPRRENKVGVGHKGFTIEVDPTMTPREAGMRRDLTINSMSLDLETGLLIDPFDGRKDLETGLLKATNPKTFVEDPLRVLRIMQLLPRKGKSVDPSTIELCRSMHGEFPDLPRERIFEEWKKLLLKAPKPSVGLLFLRECGWLSHFPELADLIGCEQNPDWHPEGDVWNHTLMVLDNAAALRHNLEEDMRLPFMFAALLHDVGKPTTTTPELSSPGHAEAGVPIAEAFMRRMTSEVSLIETVGKLVALHMNPGQLVSANASIAAWKRLHVKFDLRVLGWLSLADSSGRTGRRIDDEHKTSAMCFHFADGFPEKIEPLVQGRDLIAKGLKPSPAFREVLERAFQLQLDGFSKEEILSLI